VAGLPLVDARFLGFPLGGLLALTVVGSVQGALSGALGGALAGAVIGAAQWLVLRRYMIMGPEWILATALGVAIGDALGALLTGAGTGIGALLITGLPDRHRGGAFAGGALPAGPAPGRKPVATGSRHRLAAGLGSDVDDWRGRRARLLRVRCVGCAGLRGSHRPGDAIHSPRPDPLA
jgi:hypothetical protein